MTTVPRRLSALFRTLKPRPRRTAPPSLAPVPSPWLLSPWLLSPPSVLPSWSLSSWFSADGPWAGSAKVCGDGTPGVDAFAGMCGMVPPSATGRSVSRPCGGAYRSLVLLEFMPIIVIVIVNVIVDIIWKQHDDNAALPHCSIRDGCAGCPSGVNRERRWMHHRRRRYCSQAYAACSLRIGRVASRRSLESVSRPKDMSI